MALLARENELKSICALLARPRAGGALVLRGEAGVGKSALLSEVISAGQRAGVLKHHDAVAEQAPALSGMRRHDVGRPAIRCVRGRTLRLMLAHDAPRSC